MYHIIYGINPIYSLLNFNFKLIKKIYLNKNYFNKRISFLIKKIKNKIPIEYINKNIINIKSNTIKNQGIYAIVNNYKIYNQSFLKKISSKNNLILILEEITDPHNLGACLRVAIACKVNLIIITKYHSAKLYNPIINKVASEALENIPIIIINNIIQTINILKKKNIWIIGTTTKKTSKSLFNFNFKNISVAIIIGSEDLGLNKLTKDNCDQLIHIPMKNNKNNSLNVSVATGIILFEIIRQNYYS